MCPQGNSSGESTDRCSIGGCSEDNDSNGLPPNQALSLLSNETHIAILRAIARADEEFIPFSVLQERIGVVDSGQFNYHLNKLRRHYIRRTSEGYALRQEGIDALGLISQLCASD